jgi:hypothetical protein
MNDDPTSRGGLSARAQEKAATVTLTAAQAQRIAATLSQVDDFFYHADGRVRAALRRFAAARGWHNPAHGAVRLLDDITFAAAPLHRALKAAQPAEASHGTETP